MIGRTRRRAAVAPGPFLREFLRHEAAGAVVLLAATAIALAVANSPLAAAYGRLLHAEIGLPFGPPGLAQPLKQWVDDALMTLFFFVVGLEIKREVVVGELSSRRRALLPVLAALGGMAAPAAIYLAFNGGGGAAAGWGVPVATDIAFSLGVLALLGPRVPAGLKVFLAALAIADDIGAILVIAVFYTSGLHWDWIGFALVPLAALLAANRRRVESPLVYLAAGVTLWFAVLSSGIHATVAGVIAAFTVPAAAREPHGVAPLQRFERAVHPISTFLVLPAFALANAGIALSGVRLGSPVALGIILGLVAGKLCGVLLAVWLAVRAGVAEVPAGVGWRHLSGAAALAGIGFTMSLFIANLAFAPGPESAEATSAIFAASIVAGCLGYVLLRFWAPPAGADGASQRKG
ncbi:MAG TPA: Na+/H+ antiporter NhaA [bacterium]